MVLIKKTAAAEPFRVPTLADASPEYAALLQKQSDLYALQSKLNDERRELEKAIDKAGASATGSNVSTRVAELLGEAPDSAPMLRKQAADIRAKLADVEVAIEIVFRRLTEAKGPASVAACQISKPEYGRRVVAVVKALEAVAVARADYDDLRNQFEAEDIAWTSLVPMSLGFLGDRHDGHLTRAVKEMREAGYNV